MLSLIVFWLPAFLEVVASNSSPLKNENSDLVFVSVMFRHGDRTPTGFFPSDPYSGESYWPEGLGQLINSGKQRAYELGKWLRNRYDLFLTEEYKPDELYVESTDYDRTIMSAQSVLAGMFPPKGSQKWNSALDWQPIPVHTTPTIFDRKLDNFYCSVYKKDLELVLKSHEIQELKTKYSDVFNVLNNNTGKTVSSFEDVEKIFGTLSIEHSKNLTMPTWLKSVFPQRMGEVAKLSFVLKTWTQKLGRLKSGFLVKDIVTHLKQKTDGIKLKDSSVPNMWIYSAHDTTIASFLNTLKVFDPQLPPFSSAVLLELRKDTEENHFVKLLYRNSTTREPYVLTLPGCTSDCPLHKFVELCKPIIPGDWDKECGETTLS